MLTPLVPPSPPIVVAGFLLSRLIFALYAGGLDAGAEMCSMMSFFPRVLPFLIALLLLMMMAAPTVLADTADVPHTDKRALALLARMNHAYSSLKSLQESIVSEQTGPNAVKLHTELSVTRQGLVAAHADSRAQRTGAVDIIADGHSCYVTAPGWPGKYLQFPVAGPRDAFDAVISHGLLASISLVLFSDKDGLAQLFPPAKFTTVAYAGQTDLNGESVESVVLSDTEDHVITLAIGSRDHLLRQAMVETTDDADGFTETYLRVSPNIKLSAGTFAFTPAPGATAVRRQTFQ